MVMFLNMYTGTRASGNWNHEASEHFLGLKQGFSRCLVPAGARRCLSFAPKAHAEQRAPEPSRLAPRVSERLFCMLEPLA